MIFSDLIAYIFAYIFLVPIVVLLHELAHSFIALFFSKENVYLILGDGNKNINLHTGKFYLCFKGYKSIFGIMVGHVKCDVEDGYKALLLYLAGPIMSLLITVSLYIILKYNSQNIIFIIQMILNALFNYSLGIFLSSIIPMNYPFMPHENARSDGYNMILQLKKIKYK